jgi:hypothetical protein
LFVGLALLAMAGTARAQSAPPDPPDPPPAHTVTFLPRTLFHLDAEHLSGDDARFAWDADFGGEVDFVDYGVGRATFAANYQAVLGHEFRNFDPNQGLYSLEAATSGRVRGLELAAAFRHVSRHLSDRPKPFAIDWNMLGVRAGRSLTAGPDRIDLRLDARRVILRTFVDYRWEVDAAVRNVYRLRPGVAALVNVDLHVLGVDDTHDRGTQSGARGEGGIRLEGRAGAVELFVAAERRIDPYPLEFATGTWITAGFRLLSR